MEENIVDNNVEVPTPSGSRPQLPNATGTLVLGICSIVFCWCYGFVGIALGIIALAISNKSWKLYKENPEGYENGGNLRAGRICAIIGLSLSSLLIIFYIVYFAIVGTAIMSMSDIWSDFY